MSAPGRVAIAVSPGLLREVLHMPVTAEIIDAGLSDDGRCIELLVESPDIPSGVPIRTVTPTVTHHAERFDWAWNLPAPDFDGRPTAETHPGSTPKEDDRA